MVSWLNRMIYSCALARKANVRATCPPSTDTRSLIGALKCWPSKASTCSEATTGRKSDIQPPFSQTVVLGSWEPYTKNQREKKWEKGCEEVTGRRLTGNGTGMCAHNAATSLAHIHHHQHVPRLHSEPRMALGGKPTHTKSACVRESFSQASEPGSTWETGRIQRRIWQN